MNILALNKMEKLFNKDDDNASFMMSAGNLAVTTVTTCTLLSKLNATNKNIETFKDSTGETLLIIKKELEKVKKENETLSKRLKNTTEELKSKDKDVSSLKKKIKSLGRSVNQSSYGTEISYASQDSDVDFHPVYEHKEMKSSRYQKHRNTHRKQEKFQPTYGNSCAQSMYSDSDTESIDSDFLDFN